MDGPFVSYLVTKKLIWRFGFQSRAAIEPNPSTNLINISTVNDMIYQNDCSDKVHFILNFECIEVKFYS